MVAHLDYKPCFILFTEHLLYLVQQFNGHRRKGRSAGGLVGEFMEGSLQFIPGNWFQQVINAVYLEGFNGIFLISRGKNYGARNFYPFKDLEAESIGQLKVHKDKVRSGMMLKLFRIEVNYH